MEYDQKIHGHIEQSRYDILSLVVDQYISKSRNTILNYTMMPLSMICVQYGYKGQMVNYTHDRYHINVSSYHMTFSSLGWKWRITRL
jgi:hypothetical protein